MLKIYDDSKNYTATIVRPMVSQALPGLDNLVGVSVFGNLCLVPKTYDLTKQYVFFPAETQLSPEYLKGNDMYREATLNSNPAEKGYFEENGRVKAIKFKGNKSTGLLMPIESLTKAFGENSKLMTFEDGNEFNTIDKFEICKKYIVPAKTPGSPGSKVEKLLEKVVDSKQFPEHIDTDHFLKHIDKIDLDAQVIITIKEHGTSGRFGFVQTKNKLTWLEKLARKLGVRVSTESYNYVVGSRRVIKSIDFRATNGKHHFYGEDLWSKVSFETFAGKVNKGEMIYFEVIGKEYNGKEIQEDYSYGLEGPKVTIYRISNINEQGIEIDLPWSQVKERAKQLGVDYSIEMYTGTLRQIIDKLPSTTAYPTREEDLKRLEQYLKDIYMDKPSVLDPKVIEEGIVFRYEKYGKPKLYKMKAPLFILHETKQADKQVLDIETENS